MKPGQYDNMLPFFILLLVAISLGSAGQLLLKSGLRELAEDAGVKAIIASIFTNLRVFLGFACYGLSSLVYLVAIKHLPLSLAYPMVALSYVIVVVASWWFFHEHLPVLRIVAVGVILAGVILLAFTSDDGQGQASLDPVAVESIDAGTPAP